MKLPTCTNRLHYVSFGDRKLAIDAQSLFLYEQLPQGRFPWFTREYKQVTEGMPAVRDLEEERRRLNALRRKSQDYLYLNVSHACNMGCRYCFAKGGAYGGKQRLMSPPVALEAINWLLRTGTGGRLVVNFFGGEPLLNLSALREVLVHARKQSSHHGKSFRALISTNGTHDLRTLGDVLFSVDHRITISIDGPASIHDRNRPLRDGSPSYSMIGRNVERFIRLAGNSHLSAKATWRRGDSDLVLIAESLLALGFRRLNIGRETSFLPSSIQPENRGRNHDFDEIVTAYEGLARWYADQLNQGCQIVVQPLHSVMYAVLRAQVLRKTCSAGVSTWCVAPKGEIFPCHRFIAHEDWRAGHVIKDGLDSEALARLPQDGSLPADCDGCWAKYWCFSNSCVYLASIGRDYSQLNGFCRHMRQYLEMICFHVARLSAAGRATLRSTRSLPSIGEAEPGPLAE